MRHFSGPGSRLLAGLGLALALGCIKLGTGAGDSTSTPTSGWSGPALLESNLSASSYLPAVAVDGSGNILAGWELDAGSGLFNLYGNAYLAGGSWQTSGSLPVFSAGDTARNFRIAVGGDENFLYTWDELPSGGVRQVCVNRYSVASGMGTPLRLNTGAGSGPALAMNSSGNACVAWTEADAAYTTVQVAFYNATSLTWSTPYPLSTVTTANALNPLIGMDDANDVVVLWSEAAAPAAGPYTLKMASFINGSGWSAPVAVQSGPGPANGLYALAMGNAGAWLLWSESKDSGATFQPYTRAWTVSGLSTPLQMATAGVDLVTPLSVAISAAGDAVAAWVPAGGTDLDVALYLTATGWGAPQALVSATPGVAGAKVAMNYLGVPALVWEQLSGSDWGIYAATYSSGWAAPVLMQSSTAVSSSAPDVYVSSNSQIVVAWSQADSAGLRHIYGQRYK